MGDAVSPESFGFLQTASYIFTEEDLDFLFDAVDDWESMPGLLRISTAIPSVSKDETEQLREQLEERVHQEETVKKIRDRKKKGAIIKTKILYLVDAKKRKKEKEGQDDQAQAQSDVPPTKDGRSHQKGHR